MKLRKIEDNELLETEKDSFDDDSYDNFDLDDSYSNYGDGLSTIDKHNDLLKDLTEFDEYLKIKVTEWLGLVWNQKTEKYILDSNVEPIMNLTGARWCVNFLRPYCRKNNIITVLDKDSYSDLMDDIEEVAIINIGTRMREFGIKSIAEAMTVWNQLIHSAELVLIGAAGTKNYQSMLTTTISRNESLNMSNQNQNQSVPQQKLSYMDKAKKLIGGLN